MEKAVSINRLTVVSNQIKLSSFKHSVNMEAMYFTIERQIYADILSTMVVWPDINVNAPYSQFHPGRFWEQKHANYLQSALSQTNCGPSITRKHKHHTNTFVLPTILLVRPLA